MCVFVLCVVCTIKSNTVRIVHYKRCLCLWDERKRKEKKNSKKIYSVSDNYAEIG